MLLHTLAFAKGTMARGRELTMTLNGLVAEGDTVVSSALMMALRDGAVLRDPPTLLALRPDRITSGCAGPLDSSSDRPREWPNRGG